MKKNVKFLLIKKRISKTIKLKKLRIKFELYHDNREKKKANDIQYIIRVCVCVQQIRQNVRCFSRGTR